MIPPGWQFVMSESIGLLIGNSARNCGIGGLETRLEKSDYRPVLLETFVQLDNFRGTCYRAANWIQVGTTQGYGLDKKHKENSPVKAVFLYPLHRNFVRILCKAQPLLRETK